MTSEFIRGLRKMERERQDTWTDTDRTDDADRRAVRVQLPPRQTGAP